MTFFSGLFAPVMNNTAGAELKKVITYTQHCIYWTETQECVHHLQKPLSHQIQPHLQSRHISRHLALILCVKLSCYSHDVLECTVVFVPFTIVTLMLLFKTVSALNCVEIKSCFM